MCTLLHIHKTYTTPYHSQSGGMGERFNRTLLSMLSGYVNEYYTDWDEQLPYVMLAYCSSYCTTQHRISLCQDENTQVQKYSNRKKYHDKKQNWESFKIGDLLFVYFPRQKRELSSKLTSYKNGSFIVLAKLSDVNYKENYGPRNTPQIIHVDRVRPVRSQVLTDDDENKRVPETNQKNHDQA